MVGRPRRVWSAVVLDVAVEVEEATVDLDVALRAESAAAHAPGHDSPHIRSAKPPSHVSQMASMKHSPFAWLAIKVNSRPQC